MRARAVKAKNYQPGDVIFSGISFSDRDKNDAKIAGTSLIRDQFFWLQILGTWGSYLPKPDFMINTSFDPSNNTKSILIGDLKLTVTKAYDDWVASKDDKTRHQFDAIMYHAKNRGFHIASLVAVAKTETKKDISYSSICYALKRAAAKYGVFLSIQSFLSDI